MIICVLAVLAGCSPQTSGPKTELPLIPTQALPTVKLPRAVLPDQAVIDLELAITDEERTRGLMFRPSLAETRGMLFCYEEPGDLAIWMKNTWVSLDIVFLDGSGTVVAISESAPPCPGDPCPHYTSGGPCHAVLEIAAGTAAKHGLTVGSTIRFQDVPDFPISGPQPSPESDPETTGG